MPLVVQGGLTKYGRMLRYCLSIMNFNARLHYPSTYQSFISRTGQHTRDDYVHPKPEEPSRSLLPANLQTSSISHLRPDQTTVRWAPGYIRDSPCPTSNDG